MAEFPIQVKVDPGDSKSKIGDVERTVAKAEKQADAASRAFKTLGDAVKYMANTTISNTVRGVNSLADAIQLEHKWTTAIRGDIQGYTKDLAALDSMLKRNTITELEHAKAVALARQNAGMATMTAKTGVAGGLIEGGLGQVASIVGPAALAATAIHGITDAFAEMHARAQETAEVNASMLRYTDSIIEAKVVTEEMRQVSTLLGTDLKTTAGAFLDIADASSELNLSHEKLVDVTRSLGLILKNEGKSIGDVGMVMQTLEFALSKGTVSSAEIERIIRRFPPIAKIWREEFGATNKQLIEAADNGQLAKLGYERLFTSIRTTTEDVNKAKQAFKLQNQEMKIGESGWKQITQWQELNRIKVNEVVDANRKLIDVWDTTSLTAQTLVDDLGDVWTALKKLAEDPWANTADTRNLLAQGFDEIIAKAHLGVNAAEKFIDRWKKSTVDARREAEALAEAFAKIREPKFVDRKNGLFSESSVTSPGDIDTAWQKPITDIQDAQRATERLRMANSEWWRDSVKGANAYENAIVRAFENGEFSFSKMIDSFMADLTRLAARQAALGLIGLFSGNDTNPIGLARAAGFGKGLLGSAGLDYKVPHFASGGDGIVRGGGGGTDRVMVPIMATSGERVTVQTQGQQMRSDNAAPAQQQVLAVNVHLDDRAITKALTTRLGARAMEKVIRRNPGVAKGLKR